MGLAPLARIFVIPSEARRLLFAGGVSAACDSRFLNGSAVSE
jgi:hypothetical protein